MPINRTALDDKCAIAQRQSHPASNRLGLWRKPWRSCGPSCAQMSWTGGGHYGGPDPGGCMCWRTGQAGLLQVLSLDSPFLRPVVRCHLSTSAIRPRRWTRTCCAAVAGPHWRNAVPAYSRRAGQLGTTVRAGELQTVVAVSAPGGGYELIAMPALRLDTRLRPQISVTATAIRLHRHRPTSTSLLDGRPSDSARWASSPPRDCQIGAAVQTV